jgi:NAD(P)-dependent dehydrogenase (short-subunit alcohol dehydrogenase family)
MNQDGSFAGKVAFVTGAASGIGHAAALAFARAGASVVDWPWAEQFLDALACLRTLPLPA